MSEEDFMNVILKFACKHPHLTIILGVIIISILIGIAITLFEMNELATITRCSALWCGAIGPVN